MNNEGDRPVGAATTAATIRNDDAVARGVGDERSGSSDAARSVVVSIRLSEEEHGQIRRAADASNLPVSTIIRLWALERLQAARSGGSVYERLDRLERAVFHRGP